MMNWPALGIRAEPTSSRVSEVLPYKVSTYSETGISVTAEQSKFFTAHGIRPAYLLNVSSSAIHKNLIKLIAAYALLRARCPAVPQLVLAGAIPDHPAWGMQQCSDLLEAAAQSGVRENIVLVRYPTRDQLLTLYQHAQLFVFPSLFEGFGLAPLEAMSYGLPLVVSDRASLPEVAADAAVYVNPDDAADIARALERVVEDAELRARMIERGFQRVKFFGTWKRVARETLAVYEQAFNLRKSEKKQGRAGQTA